MSSGGEQAGKLQLFTNKRRQIPGNVVNCIYSILQERTRDCAWNRTTSTLSRIGTIRTGTLLRESIAIQVNSAIRKSAAIPANIIIQVNATIQASIIIPGSTAIQARATILTVTRIRMTITATDLTVSSVGGTNGIPLPTPVHPSTNCFPTSGFAHCSPFCLLPFWCSCLFCSCVSGELYKRSPRRHPETKAPVTGRTNPQNNPSSHSETRYQK